MGALLSRFKKRPTTSEQLKKIEDGLQKIEEYKRITEKKQKRTVASVILYGAALYILACVIVFVWYLPESWLVRLGLLIPLILVPLIIYWMKRLISTYFQSKMLKANEQYADLQKKKKDIIDNVMETETFNKAREILEKFAPEKLGKKGGDIAKISPVAQKQVPVIAENTNTEVAITKPVKLDSASATDLRKRVVQPPPKYPVFLRSNIGEHMEHKMSLSARLNDPTLGPRRPLPHPVLPQKRSLSDKVIDYIVGDGPNHRYALICTYCKGHNGMAIEEEFPYLSYTCCYCLSYNSARKTRPSAPRLETVKQEGDDQSSQDEEETKEIPREVQLKMEEEENKEFDDFIRQEKEKWSQRNKLKVLQSKFSDYLFPKPVKFEDFIMLLDDQQESESSGNNELEEKLELPSITQGPSEEELEDDQDTEGQRSITEVNGVEAFHYLRRGCKKAKDIKLSEETEEREIRVVNYDEDFTEKKEDVNEDIDTTEDSFKSLEETTGS